MSPAAVATTTSDSGHETSVLIVDDHELIRRGMGTLVDGVDDLEIVGQTGTAKEALRLARKLQPDVVVVDIELPDMDGFELMQRLHKRVPHSHTLVYSMYNDEAFIQEALNLGASGYIVKDSPSSELIQGMREVSQGRRFLSSNLDIQDDPRARAFARLTPREREVLRLVVDGLSSDDIADELTMQRRTVDTHRAHIKKKFGGEPLSSLIPYIVRRGLLTHRADGGHKKRGHRNSSR